MPPDDTPVLRRPAVEREALAQLIADRLNAPMAALGVIFLLLVLAETVVRPTGTLSVVFQVASWVIWAAFVAEFVVRLVVAPSRVRFLRRNWWQLVFLALPFLRFLRLLRLGRAVRVTRVGRVLSSAVRGTRTAASRLGGRLAWLLVVTAIVVLAASQLLYELGEYESYADALHRAALATISAEPIGQDHGFLKVLDVVLAAYSVVVFATVAGSVGAYLVERRADEHASKSATS